MITGMERIYTPKRIYLNLKRRDTFHYHGRYGTAMPVDTFRTPAV